MAATPVTVWQPSQGWVRLDLARIWAFRELLYFFVWRDIKVRYKQTALGVGWAVLQPLLTMLVFTLFFGQTRAHDSLPYPLFCLAGLLPWTFCAQAIGHAANSVVGAAHLIRKVYFPRLIVPGSTVLAAVLDLGVSFALMGVLYAWYGVWPTWRLVTLPLFTLLALAAVMGIGLWLAALNVLFRDVRYVVPFFLQLWLFVSPIIYPSERVVSRLERWGWPGWLYGLNPIVGVVDGFRWALLPAQPLALASLGVSTFIAAAALLSGLYYFRRMEKSLADLA